MDKKLIHFTICSLLLSGCAASNSRQDAPPVLEVDQIVESSEQFGSIASTKKKLPFILDILDEFNDGSKLHILARVRPLAVWNSEETVIRLSGLSNGEVIGKSHFPLNKLKQDTSVLSPGDELTVSLQVPSRQISDYQLELLWGGEALPLLKRSISEILLIDNIRVSRGECDEYPCSVPLTISADLINSGRKTINQATIAVGFKWVDDLQAEANTAVPISSEESVNIPQLNLMPGAKKSLKFRLATPVPQGETGGYQPVLRIVDAASGSS